MLAALQAQNLEPLIDEVEWHDNQPDDFHSRLVAGHHRFPAGGENIAQDSDQLASIESSMAAVSIHPHRTPLASSAPSVYAPSTNASTHVPSLVLSNSTLRSSGSTNTGQAENAQTYALNEDGDSDTPASTTGIGRLACCFKFLACSYRSDDFTEWNTHCLSHFRGHLPQTADCPFLDCTWSKTGPEAWHHRSVHIIVDHRSVGTVDTNSRPSTSLIHHLWSHDIIDNAQQKELRSHGCLRDDQVYTRPAGPARDRRQERRSRTGGRR